MSERNDAASLAVGKAVHRKSVETLGSLRGGSLRFRAACECGWATAPFLTAMQAHYALEDHFCRPAWCPRCEARVPRPLAHQAVDDDWEWSCTATSDAGSPEGSPVAPGSAGSRTPDD